MTDFRTGLDKPLSKDTLAVFDAYDIGFSTPAIRLAEALRAIAELDDIKPVALGPQEEGESDLRRTVAIHVKQRHIRIYRKLRAMADELDPPPLSLKQQALEDFDALISELDRDGSYSNCTDRIRRALNSLPD